MNCHGSKTPPLRSSPDTGTARLGMDMALDDLAAVFGDVSDPVYFYVVRSVREVGGHLIQLGSGPNLDGGILTLCTCKHSMRASRAGGLWPGVWLAGFTGRSKQTTSRRFNLFYLARVAQAFDSHRDLWHKADMPASVRETKAADRNRLGDLFRPKGLSVPAYEPGSYETPIAGHCHEKDNEWHKDISFHGRRGRPAALLIGDPTLTFVWSTPSIHISDEKLGRGHRCKDWTLGRFVRALRV